MVKRFVHIELLMSDLGEVKIFAAHCLAENLKMYRCATAASTR